MGRRNLPNAGKITTNRLERYKLVLIIKFYSLIYRFHHTIKDVLQKTKRLPEVLRILVNIVFLRLSDRQLKFIIRELRFSCGHHFIYRLLLERGAGQRKTRAILTPTTRKRKVKKTERNDRDDSLDEEAAILNEEAQAIAKEKEIREMETQITAAFSVADSPVDNLYQMEVPNDTASFADNTSVEV